MKRSMFTGISQREPDETIDEKSLFGTPRSASARTGRKHDGTGLTQRCHGGSMAESGRNVNTTTKPAAFGRTEYSPAAQKPPVRVPLAGKRQSGSVS
jgi:hypothetical protein